MHWIYLLLAVVALAIAFKAASLALMGLCLLAALGLLVAWALGFLAQRVGSRTRDEAALIDPQELRRLREEAEARRAQAPPTEPPAT
ncbi:MAG: hypothetical protein JWL98_2043 [Xanthomonadaceae bacterium]|nr:hypothetical protein [Xanthomonadaceae bacterium]